MAIDLPDYSETSNCPIGPATLALGASCTVSVMFTPTAIGARHAYLTIVDASTQRVSLSGNGLIDIAASPTSLAFADTVVSRISSAKSITVKNIESTGITISNISSSLPDYLITSDSCPLSPSTLAAGASCKINVVFAPTALGARDGMLTVTDNASNSPSVSLTGNGIPAVAVSPSSLTFSGQPLGTFSAVQL